MTSSLRNSIHRRNHKERSQLAHRAKLGLLEKHADYVKRARDYHSKQDRLTRLKQKAAERNKDEFYFSMQRERTHGGVHIQDRGNSSLPTDIVKVLKTQDENYVRTMRAAGLKKIDKIKNQLMALADLLKPGSLEHNADDDEDDLDNEEIDILRKAGVLPDDRKGKGKSRRHIIFVDSEEQARQYAEKLIPSSDADADDDVAMHPEPEPVDLGWKLPDEKKKAKKRRPSTSAGPRAEKEIAAEERRELAARHRRRLLKELAARLARNTQLRYAEREFEMQRLLMGKGGRKKLAGAEKVEGDDDSEEDEDAIDARKGKGKAKAKKVVDEATYKPRVYKWRLERKGK